MASRTVRSWLSADSKLGIRTRPMLAGWPMVDTAQPVCLSSSGTERGLIFHGDSANLRKREHRSVLLQ
jgi:hypothetical protein